MARFLPDSSCMIAALCVWHEHHQPAAQEIERRLGNGESLIVAAPALVETYAVLTRLPTPHRLTPADSRTLLDANFMGDHFETVALTMGTYHRLLREAAERGTTGGSVYDAVIIACGLAAKVDVILAFNERQFRFIAASDIEIVVPSTSRDPRP